MVHSNVEWQDAHKFVIYALQNTNYACQSLEEFPGGYINFTFRNTPVNAVRNAETVATKTMDENIKMEKMMGESFVLHKTRSVGY